MKKEGYVYQCKICSDGRLYNGVWSVASGVPHPLPENVDGGADYVWDGKTLTYSPAEKTEESAE